jgi:hypothetical protein
MKKLILLIFTMVMLLVDEAGAQSLSLRTSVTMLATATPNIEISMPVSKKVSLHLPVMYNPWVMRQNSRFQQLTTMPGIRYWQQQCGVHYFASFYGIATRYHVGGWMDRKYRYDGTGYGAGVGFGYSWVLSDHWNFELEGGVGLIWADYDKCGWQSDSHRYGSYRGLRVIPSKLDISVAYYF